MTEGLRKTVVGVVKYGVVAAAVGFLLWSGRLDLSHFRLREDGMAALAWASAAMLAQYLLSILRWGVLLRAAVIRMSYAEIFRVGMISDFFNSVFFGGLGGDLVKVVYVARAGGGKADSLACVFMDRVVGLVALLALCGASLLLNVDMVLATPGLRTLAQFILGAFGSVVLACMTGLVALARGRKQGLALWAGLTLLVLAACLTAPGFLAAGKDGEALRLLAAGACGIAFFAALVAPSLLPGRTLDRLISRLPLGDKIMSLVHSVLVYREHLAVVGAMFVFSLFLQVLILLSLHWLGQAMPTPNPPEFLHVLFAAPVAFLTSSLPLPGGGLGVGEFAFDEVLRHCSVGGLPVVGGAEIFLSWRLLSVVLGLIGLPWYLRDAPRKTELDEVAAE